MGKINPERINEGRRVTKVATEKATCWESAITETRIPMPVEADKNSKVVKNKRIILPLISTPNRKYPTMRIMAALNKDRIRYGSILPEINSKELIGETFICSMVPLSFSLTSDKETLIAAVIRSIIAMRPGIRKRVVCRSGLYQKRASNSIGT
jgi:hypothetical protein